MSDGFVSIVPAAIELERPAETAHQAVEWLVERKVIVAVQTDCVPGGSLGYPPGPRYKDILASRGGYRYFEKSCQSFETLLTNGLEIITGRTVFHAGGNGLSAVSCPCCRANLIDFDGWSDFLTEWLKEGTSWLQCPECRQKSLLNAYDFTIEPQLIWAFSNFGLTFWNWPGEFKSSFIVALEGVIESPVKIVYGRL